MELYLTDDEFNRYFEYLQIMGVDFPNSSEKWEQHKAGVSHIDPHGVVINKGDNYYSRRPRNIELKFSHKTMDEFLFLLFENTPELHEKCEFLLAERQAIISKAKSRRKW